MKEDIMRLYGYDKYFETHAEMYAGQGLTPARITEVHRDLFKAMAPEGETWCRLKGSAMYAMQTGDGYPAAGDFAMLNTTTGGEALIHAILPRKSKFSRPKPGGHGDGERCDEQVIAANFDHVFITMSLNYNFNLRRLERYLTAAWQSGGTPCVILTKSDLRESDEQILAAQGLAAGVDVHAVSAVTGEGVDALNAYLQPGKTIVLLGSSGVGKSTLLNRLAGKDLMTTGDIRSDGAGRHTTTHRELFLLPCGTCIIDTPGMRELGMGDTSGLDDTFNEIAMLAERCRFADCSHQQEPGCAVREALQNGTLDRKRYESYLKLQKEARFLRYKDEKRLREQSQIQISLQRRELRKHYARKSTLEYD